LPPEGFDVDIVTGYMGPVSPVGPVTAAPVGPVGPVGPIGPTICPASSNETPFHTYKFPSASTIYASFTELPTVGKLPTVATDPEK
jgi:hypothetical protein